MVNFKTGLFRLLIIAISFCLGYWVCYERYVPPLESKIENLNLELRGLEKKQEIKVTDEGITEIEYIVKKDNLDSDVEIKDNNNVNVKYNDIKVKVPSNIKEEHKFDKGKLVIEKKQDTTVDLTDTINKITDLKAEKYDRIGKADFGMLYSNKDSDFYGGIRYNAKAYDIGYYHNVIDNDWIIGLHYKF